MAAGKWKVYESAKELMAEGTLDLDDPTNWKIAIHLSTSNANNLAAGDEYGDLTNPHATANGYPAGGVALTNVVWTRTGGTVKLSCDAPVFTASGGSIVGRFLVIYKDATVNGIVKPIMCVCLMDTTPADVTVTAGNTLTVTIAAGGIIDLTGAAVD